MEKLVKMTKLKENLLENQVRFFLFLHLLSCHTHVEQWLDHGENANECDAGATGGI